MRSAPELGPACARCGRDALFDFDSLWLCLDCYHVAGSTCAGITRPGTDSADASLPTPDASSGSVC